MLAHCFLKEFQRCLLVPRLRDEALQHLTFVVDGSPEVVPLAVDLYENLVEVPSPVAGFHAPDAPLPDLGGELRPKPVPPEPNRLVTDLDTTLVQQILDVPERQREPDVHHDRQADDLGRGLEVLEGVAFGHLGTLAGAMPRLKQSSSDKTAGSHPLDAARFDLGGEHRPKPVPPEPNRLVADLNAALMQQVLDIPKRQRESDVHHHRQADDLGTGLEVLEWVALTHGGRLRDRPTPAQAKFL